MYWSYCSKNNFIRGHRSTQEQFSVLVVTHLYFIHQHKWTVKNTEQRMLICVQIDKLKIAVVFNCYRSLDDSSAYLQPLITALALYVSRPKLGVWRGKKTRHALLAGSALKPHLQSPEHLSEPAAAQPSAGCWTRGSAGALLNHCWQKQERGRTLLLSLSS